jgi:hypothetical protein
MAENIEHENNFVNIAKAIKFIYADPNLKKFRPTINNGIKFRGGNNSGSNQSNRANQIAALDKLMNLHVDYKISLITGYESLETILKKAIRFYNTHNNVSNQTIGNKKKFNELREASEFIRIELMNLRRKDKTEPDIENQIKQKEEQMNLFLQQMNQTLEEPIVEEINYKSIATQALKILAKGGKEGLILFDCIYQTLCPNSVLKVEQKHESSNNYHRTDNRQRNYDRSDNNGTDNRQRNYNRSENNGTDNRQINYDRSDNNGTDNRQRNYNRSENNGTDNRQRNYDSSDNNRSDNRQRNYDRSDNNRTDNRQINYDRSDNSNLQTKPSGYVPPFLRNKQQKENNNKSNNIKKEETNISLDNNFPTLGTQEQKNIPIGSWVIPLSKEKIMEEPKVKEHKNININTHKIKIEKDIKLWDDDSDDEFKQKVVVIEHVATIIKYGIDNVEIVNDMEDEWTIDENDGW